MLGIFAWNQLNEWLLSSFLSFVKLIVSAIKLQKHVLKSVKLHALLITRPLCQWFYCCFTGRMDGTFISSHLPHSLSVPHAASFHWLNANRGETQLIMWQIYGWINSRTLQRERRIDGVLDTEVQFTGEENRATGIQPGSWMSQWLLEIDTAGMALITLLTKWIIYQTQTLLHKSHAYFSSPG